MNFITISALNKRLIDRLTQNSKKYKLAIRNRSTYKVFFVNILLDLHEAFAKRTPQSLKLKTQSP